jgi:hypothetical protein
MVRFGLGQHAWRESISKRAPSMNAAVQETAVHRISLEFPDERVAAHFEKYLKSGSGRAFAKRHFGRP